MLLQTVQQECKVFGRDMTVFCQSALHVLENAVNMVWDSTAKMKGFEQDMAVSGAAMHPLKLHMHIILQYRPHSWVFSQPSTFVGTLATQIEDAFLYVTFPGELQAQLC